jgi:hypothetical protein
LRLLQPQAQPQSQPAAAIPFTHGLATVQSHSEEFHMAHFVKLNENNIVLEINVVHNNELLDENGHESEAKGIAFLTAWSGGYANWKQTSYNGTIRKNYAGVGYTYDSQRDAFIAPQPYASWLLDEQTCLWNAPTPMPTDDKQYRWDEPTTSWIEVTNV